jgi:hypothetical protein
MNRAGSLLRDMASRAAFTGDDAMVATCVSSGSVRATGHAPDLKGPEQFPDSFYYRAIRTGIGDALREQLATTEPLSEQLPRALKALNHEPAAAPVKSKLRAFGRDGILVALTASSLDVLTVPILRYGAIRSATIADKSAIAARRQRRRRPSLPRLGRLAKARRLGIWKLSACAVLRRRGRNFARVAQLH